MTLIGLSSGYGFSQGVQEFCSSGCPAGISIPDDGCPTYTTSTITVAGVGKIDNNYGLEQVCIYIPHTFRSDLNIYLQAPDGTQVELSTGNGGSGDNFGAGCSRTNMLCFSATAPSPITSWQSSHPPTGTYQPEGCLGLVNNGQNADGVWTLQVCDGEGVDVGSIQGWCLVFSNNPAPYSPVAPGFSFTAPFTHTGTTCTSNNSIPSTCNPAYGSGKDVLYGVNFPSSGNYKVALTNNSGTGYTGWFLTSSKPSTCGMGGCIAQAVSGTGNTASSCVNITNAGDYYIVIDHGSGVTCASYTLEVLLPLNVYFPVLSYIVVQGVQDTFSVNAATDCGAASLNWCQWDFGDGTPQVTSTDNDTFHTYSSAGIYTLKVRCASGSVIDGDSATVIVVSSCPAATCSGYISLAGVDDPGIYSVRLGAFVLASKGASEGNLDFSCSAGTYVLRGDRDTLIVQMGPASSGRVVWYVKAWADWNNNGVLETAEVLGQSISTSSTHSIVFDVPVTATVGSVVRLRILGMAYDGRTHGPCDTISFGQYEDYALFIRDYTLPPVALFEPSETISCDGIVTFNNQSYGVIASWEWNFGDGNTNNSDWSPTHTYLSPGTYIVKLRVCNPYGCDSLTRQVTIRTDIGAPLPPSCVPSRILTDPLSFGIFKVRIGGMVKTSGQSPTGYSDFTCPDTAHIMEGTLFPVIIKGSAQAAQDWRIWIDLNNDGVLQHPGELVVSADNTADTLFYARVPWGTAPPGVPLRMRIITEAGGTLTSTTDPCYNPSLGEVEDYSIIIEENTLPPVAMFTTQPPNPEGECGFLSVKFIDQSLNAVDTWLWYFGDGDSSREQNPLHRYLDPGVYSVFLIVCGPYGCDTSDTIVIAVHEECIYQMRAGTWDSVFACSGILYDDGGSDGNYSDRATSRFKIRVPGASYISIVFDTFDYALNDYLNVYCSATISGSPDFSFTKGSPPQLGYSYACFNTEYVVIEHKPTNDAVTAMGFRLRWSSVGNTLPLVDFVVDYSSSDFCNMEYTFINRSTCVDSWYWITEDGTIVGTRHLHHRFYSGGPGSIYNPGIMQPYISSDELTDGFLTVVLVGKRNTPQGGTLRNWKKLSVPMQGVSADFDIVPSPVVELARGGRVYFRDRSLSYRTVIYNKWLFGTGDSVENFDEVMYVYRDTGRYTVIYVACNDICCDTVTRQVDVVGVRSEPVITGLGYGIAENSPLVVFPNPFSEGVYILLPVKFDSQEEVCLYVEDMTGRVLVSRCIGGEFTLYPYFLELYSLAQGMYILKVDYHTREGQMSERMVIMKGK